MTFGQLRRAAAWLLAVPFFWTAAPTATSLAAGSLPALLGLGLRAWAAGTIRKNEALATTGPYAHTRNPLYLGSLLLGSGLAVAGGRWLWPVAFILFFGVVYGRAMKREERALDERFGEAYRAYAAAVPLLVPRVAPFRGGAEASAPGFTWARFVQNREWEAALGTAAAFAYLTVLSLR